MASSAVARKTRARKTTGLRYWMLRVLDECRRVSTDFNPDAVHDLRVSLRRCRSLADGLMALDPHPDWKAMKKAGKRLFQRLGNLRDIHVMQEWVEKLDQAMKGSKAFADLAVLNAARSKAAIEDAAAKALLQILTTREQEQKREAQAALLEFDEKQWRRWSRSLPMRAARFRQGSLLYKHLALESWTEARKLHSRALRNRSQIAFHLLRIGIKRFRYVVENFLLVEHKAWGDDLKEMQDLLGEVHDLDVLWFTASSCHVFADNGSRQSWHKHILTERGKRIKSYRAKMVGGGSLWETWRAALPQGKQIRELAARRMKLWASSLDPDFPHSERVAGLALQIYDGLLRLPWQPAIDAASARSSLFTAALLHDVGKSEGNKGHHKTSRTLILKHRNPIGWEQSDLERAAIIARFHRGVLPTTRHKGLRDLLPNEQKATIQLAAILRIANAFDASHDGRIRRLHVEADNVPQERSDGFLRKHSGLAAKQALMITAEGYSPTAPGAQIIAAERHLLEMVLRRPVMINSAKRADPSAKRINL